MSAMFRDCIRIEGVRVECVVGVYPHERGMTQPLSLDAELVLDLERAGEAERLRHSIDYAAMTHQLVFLLEHCRFRMLETAAHALLKYLLAPPAAGERRAPVQEARLRLTKPKALGGVGVPSVELRRDASWVKLGHEEKPFGMVDVIHETRDAGIYRLSIAPGGEIPMHVHHDMTEAELVLTDGLSCQGAAAPAGSYRRWPKRAAHFYRNDSERWQSILCVDSPPFTEADELSVDEPAAEVPMRFYAKRSAAE